VKYYYSSIRDGINPVSPTEERIYRIEVSGIGNYCGKWKRDFRIVRGVGEWEISLNSDSYVYTGKEIKPEIVKETIISSVNPKELIEGTDYTVSYKNNVKIHTSDNSDEKAPAVVITGKGIYEGSSQEIYFNIDAISISGNGFTVAAVSDTYHTGGDITPKPKVTYGKTTLKKDTDYTITYYQKGSSETVIPKEAGEYIVRITGKDRFKDNVDREFRIVDKTSNVIVSKLSVSVKNKPYTGVAVALEPSELVVKDGGKTLTLNEDYTASYLNNVDIGVATVIITGLGKYVGTNTVSFKITGTDLGKVKINGFVSTFQYEQGAEVKQDISENPLTDTCYLGSSESRLKGISKALYDEKDETAKRAYDFTYEYLNNTLPGKASLILTGVNAYTGVVKKQYTIKGYTTVNKLSVLNIPKKASYTGVAIRPAFVVMNGSYELKGIESNNANTTGFDYVYTYRDNKEIGKASIEIEGINAYSGELTKTFNITGIPVSKLTIGGFVGTKEYSGSEITQSLTFTYKETKNSTPENVASMLKTQYNNESNVGCIYYYENNVNAGTATMIIQGVNGFTGTVKKKFKITPYNIKDDASDLFSVSVNSAYIYQKSGVCPEPVVKFKGTTLVKGTDYKLSYLYNKAVNDKTGSKVPTVKVTGINNFKGDDLTATFIISQRDVNDGSIKLTASDMVFTEKAGAWKSTVKVTDSNGKKLEAKKDYDANVIYTYEYIPTGAKILDGSKKPAVEVTRAKSYVVEPTDIVPYGCKIKASIKGINNYKGQTTDNYVVYRICKADISKKSITPKESKVFTGEPIELTWNDLKFPAGIDVASEADFNNNFELVSYKNNTSVGSASLVIKAKEGGLYTGSKTIPFKIIKKGF